MCKRHVTLTYLENYDYFSLMARLGLSLELIFNFFPFSKLNQCVYVCGGGEGLYSDENKSYGNSLPTLSHKKSHKQNLWEI